MSTQDQAVLAEHIVQLTEQLEEVQQLLRTVVWGMNRETDEIKESVLVLAARVKALEPQPPESEQPPQARAWVDYASAEDWQELATWVDWLCTTYDLVTSRTVLPCWPAHRGVAEELAALRTSWHMAAITGRSKKPTDAMVYWHDRWLHPTLLRLREGFQQRSCSEHHATPRPGRTTEKKLLDEALKKATAAVSAMPPHDPQTGELREP